MSLICGSETNEESRKAMVKSPGPPMASAKPVDPVDEGFHAEGIRRYRRALVIICSSERQPAEPTLLAAAAMIAAPHWIVFLRADLVLSHYDAKAHLVVARRDHRQHHAGLAADRRRVAAAASSAQRASDADRCFYRTGAFASLISIACFGIMTYAAARLVTLATGSRARRGCRARRCWRSIRTCCTSTRRR